jgi:hypothetical protein
MAMHRPYVGVDSPEVVPTGDAPPAVSGGVVGLLSGDEPLGRSKDLEFRPLLEGGEFSTSQTTSQLAVTVEAKRDELAIIDEIALSLESNGQATVSMTAEDDVTYTGSVDISLPFDGAYLPDGDRIRIFHQSTNGGSTTARISVTGRRV